MENDALLSLSLEGKLRKECGEILVPPVLDLIGAEGKEPLLLYSDDDDDEEEFVDAENGVPSCR